MRRKIYWIEGDGIGPEIWAVTKPLIDAVLKKCYGNEYSIDWHELLAGDKAVAQTGSPLPEETIKALTYADVAIKGPLGTPVGSGLRSLNVAIRQKFDLYACIRPIVWYKGVISPMRKPENVNMVIFRENTEDVYAGIEFQANTEDSIKLINFMNNEFGTNLNQTSAIGIKPMTEYGCKRLVRSAIEYAIKHKLPSVTLVHKGNIMKFTEGAFQAWGYEVAREFGDKLIAEIEVQKGGSSEGKIIIKDRIADAMFQEMLLRPEEYSVIATPNLNGDYISDALAAQVGGLGIAPGVNMSETFALFEATHGTAPLAAGKDIANPCSLLLSAAMMLDYMGLEKAGNALRNAIIHLITEKTVTADLAREMENATAVSCSEFGRLLLKEFE